MSMSKRNTLRAERKKAHQAWMRSQARRDYIWRMCKAHGRHIGKDAWGEVWVLDGQVWLIDAREATKWGDWFEFCDTVRKGNRPTFTPREGGYSP
jgi:hypothetical protein